MLRFRFYNIGIGEDQEPLKNFDMGSDMFISP